VNTTSRHTGVAKGENQMNPVHETEPYILVEGPKRADAEFYGKWLLMASKAEAFWKKALKCRAFERKIQRVIYLPHFDQSASVFLFQLKKNLVSFTIPLRVDNWAESTQFALMAEMGFFVLTDQRYQMAIPARLNIDVVKSAALRFAETEDEDGHHPEWLVAAMPYAQVEEWQRRLGEMDQEQRAPTGPFLSMRVLQNKGNVGGSCGHST
jgi:hypothetical protein